MLITCPSCASEYVLDAARIAPEGRTVRCASCRVTFFVTRPADLEAEAPVTEDGGAAEEQSPPPVAAETRPRAARPAAKGAPRPRGRRGPGVRPAAPSLVRRPPLWLGLGALAAAMAIVGARQAIVSALPQSARLYAAIGLPVNLRGLAIRDVAAYQVAAGELVIEGDIANLRRAATALPPLTFELRDEEGRAIHGWSTEPPRASLEAAETARFRVASVAPPGAAKQILVRFADAPETAPPEHAKVASPGAAAPPSGRRPTGHEPTTHEH